jgi:hypothetical protein
MLHGIIVARRNAVHGVLPERFDQRNQRMQ